MKLGVLFSGGKDSCLALHKAIKEGHEITYLLSIIPDNFDSFMFHKPYLNLLKMQAKMLGLEDKLIIQKSKGVKEKEVEDLRELILKIKNEVDGVCVGGIASNYQGDRIKKICDELKLKFYAPILNYNEERVWNELLSEGFKVILTKIACDGLGKEWLGKIIDEDNFEGLKKLAEKYKFRLDFEGGEAESAVVYMPKFKKEIKVRFSIKSEGKYRHFINKLELI